MGRGGGGDFWFAETVQPFWLKPFLSNNSLLSRVLRFGLFPLLHLLSVARVRAWLKLKRRVARAHDESVCLFLHSR